MKSLNTSSTIVVVHGTNDAVCPFADAEEFVDNLNAAKLDVETHFIEDDDLDGSVFTSTGHPLGDRTKIVLRVAGKFLQPDSPDRLRRSGPTDFDRREDIRYQTPNGQYVISYASGIPTARFVPKKSINGEQ